MPLTFINILIINSKQVPVITFTVSHRLGHHDIADIRTVLKPAVERRVIIFCHQTGRSTQYTDICTQMGCWLLLTVLMASRSPLNLCINALVRISRQFLIELN